MTSKTEIAKILAYLLADSGREVRAEKIQVWHDHFGKFPPEALWAAAKHLSVKGFKEWEPRSQELRESLAEVSASSSEKLSGDEAFNLAVAAVKRFGSYQEDRALKSLPRPVSVALHRFGYKELCMAEEAKHGVHRAQFARIFDACKDRQQFDRTTSQPTSVGNILDQLPQLKLLKGAA